ncbi:MAG: hypothetical protein IJ526_01840 [Lachnospiraceae bacterium]|nr:hypothetical protein [Lachnospiraceae bacterium]
MIDTNYSGRYVNTGILSAGKNTSSTRTEVAFAGVVDRAEQAAISKTSQKKSGKIAESMQKYPQYAKDWKREIENGHKLTAINPPAKSRYDMTMDEYKSYISSVIDKIPEDPSRATTESSIHISDEAWETMKDDPDFEAYVLGGIEDIYTFHNPWMSPPNVKRWEVLEFGVPMENFKGSSWGDMSMGANSDAEDLFKTRSKGESYHKKPDPAAIKRVEERQREQKRLKEKRDKEWLNDKYEKQRLERIEFNRTFYLRESMPQDSFKTQPTGMSGAFMAYEMMAGIW